MARAPTAGLGVVARAAPRPPPPRACCSPGTAIALGRNTEAVSMTRAPTDGLGVAAWADPRPPHSLVVSLAPRLCLVMAIAEEKWQRLCPWLVRQQMVLAYKRYAYD